MKKNNIILYILLLLGLGACTKTVDFTLPSSDIKPVLNSLIEANQIIYARVSLLRNYKDRIKEPENITVKLYKDGVFVEDMKSIIRFDQLYFQSSLPAQVGSKYSITAQVDNYDVISAEDIVPMQAELTTTSMEVENQADGELRTLIKFKLKDSGDEANFYRIKLYNIVDYGYSGELDTYRVWFDVNALADNGVIDVFDDGGYTEYYTDDALFNGLEKEFILNSYDNFPTNKAILEVTALSGESYKYLKSIYDRGSGTDFLTEPSTIYTNIKNGLGIIGGMHKRSWIINR